MENKIDKYIDLAKQVHLAHVPFDKSEAETLLSENKCGTAQNFFKRFINYFGKHHIMTITTITFLLVSASLFIAENSDNIDTANHKLHNQYTVIHIDSTTMKQKQSKDENFRENKLNENLTEKPDNIDFTKIDWRLVNFYPDSWSFMWTYSIESIKGMDKNGKFKVAYIDRQTKPNNEHLLGLLLSIEDTINNTADINYIKQLCFLDIEEYFEQLSEYSKQFMHTQSESFLKMMNLYANISRTFLNNPKEQLQIKSNGLILPKETLEKLGMEFSDSTLSFPYDQYFSGDKMHLERASYYKTDKINILQVDYPESVLLRNRVFEWQTKQKKYDKNGDIVRLIPN